MIDGPLSLQNASRAATNSQRLRFPKMEHNNSSICSFKHTIYFGGANSSDRFIISLSSLAPHFTASVAG